MSAASARPCAASSMRKCQRSSVSSVEPGDGLLLVVEGADVVELVVVLGGGEHLGVDELDVAARLGGLHQRVGPLGQRAQRRRPVGRVAVGGQRQRGLGQQRLHDADVGLASMPDSTRRT